MSDKYHYAGAKIDRARAKYGSSSFLYEVLSEKYYISKKLAIEDLNRLEIYYIGLYDSYRNGYNCTIGGDGVQGFNMSVSQKEHLRECNLGKKLSASTKRKIGIASRRWQNTPINRGRMSSIRKGRKNPNAIAAMTLAKERPILQFTMSGEFIREFPSIKAAYEFLGKEGNITSVCKGRRASAFGYVWKYK